MKHNIILTIISIILLSVPAAKSQVRVLQLKEAVDLGVKNSKQLKASKARIDAAIAQVKEAEENRLPNFNVTGSYLRLSSANVSVKSNNNNNPTQPKISQALYGIANASYPIYAGGRIKYAIESAKYLEEATRLDADNDEQAVILNILNSYTNLYKAYGAMNVIKENLNSSRSRDTSFSRLEQNGLLARNDLLKAELQTSSIELLLLDAENNWQLANINMDLLVGLPENTELQIDSTSFGKLMPVKGIAEYEDLAIRNRKDIQALASRKKAATTAIKSAKTEGLPTVALSGGYIAAYVPNFITITNAINLGIGVQYNLASLWKTNTKLQQTKAKENELAANEEQLDDAVRLQVNQAYQSYLLAQKRIDVYQKAFLQATENYRITKNKYDNSLATVTDLLDADVSLQQTRLSVASAKADAILAYDKLLQTAGLLSATR